MINEKKKNDLTQILLLIRPFLQSIKNHDEKKKIKRHKTVLIF